jgi:adenylate kinase
MDIILLGPPGSGKGTQASKILEKFNYIHISLGEVLRGEAKKDPELKKILDEGNFVSNDLIEKIFTRFLSNQSGKRFLLDGVPRSLSQAEMVDRVYKKFNRVIAAVIYLDVDNDALLKRIENRWICRVGDIEKIMSGSRESLISVCKGELVKRDDDNLNVFKNRLEIYTKETSPLIDFYKKQSMLVEINGKNSPEQVFEDIKIVLNRLDK